MPRDDINYFQNGLKRFATNAFLLLLINNLDNVIVEKSHFKGLFTGSAFPQGGAIINSNFLAGKIRKIL